MIKGLFSFCAIANPNRNPLDSIPAITSKSTDLRDWVSPSIHKLYKEG